MWLGWIAAAHAAAPGAMIAQGEQQTETEVLRLESSMNRRHVIAVTDTTVVRLVGEGRQFSLQSGGIFAADVSNAGIVALAHAGGVTVHGANGQETLRLTGYSGRVRDLALSSDGTLLAVAATDGVTLHRAADGKQLWTRSGETFGVTFNREGSRVIAAIETGNLILRTFKGRVAGGFDQDPAIWFSWTPKALYTRQATGAPQAWDPATFAPLDPIPVAPGVNEASAHPSGEWLLVDGCVAGSDLCLGANVTASTFSADGALWAATGDRVRRWKEAPSDAVETAFSVPTGQTVTGVSATSNGDWLIVTSDGRLTRATPAGDVVYEVPVPECGSPCRPVGVGATEGEVWVASSSGTVARYDGVGQAIGKPQRSKSVALGRMGNGAWVSLDKKGRARVSSKPGKGKPSYAIEQAQALAVGEKGYAVLAADQVHPFKADGTPRPAPRLGPGRLPRSIAVGPYGLGLAVVDDAGTLHCFSADGRPIFRTPLNLGDEPMPIAWSDNGQWIYVGASPLTVIDARQGSFHSQLVISPRGLPSHVGSNPTGYLGVVVGDEVSQLLRALRVYDPTPEEPAPEGDEPG
ncbi:MAG: hypothetical protein AAGA48_35150 [Myxococcota bacterium]